MADRTAGTHIVAHHAHHARLGSWGRACALLILLPLLSCRTPAPGTGAATDGTASTSAVPIPEPGPAPATPSFLSRPGHAVSLRCTSTRIVVAHGEWSSRTTQTVRTFEHVLGTADLQRWAAQNTEGPAAVWDVLVDDTVVQWLPDAVIVWPATSDAECNATPSNDPGQPDVCAQAVTADAPWTVAPAVDASATAELTAALNDLQGVPEGSGEATADCRLQTAVWQSPGAFGSQNEIRMRWCRQSGPVYVQERRAAPGLASVNLERCHAEADPAP